MLTRFEIHACNRRLRQPLVRAVALLSLTAPLLSGASPTSSADRMRENIEVLSSDEFEGRAPGTAGEEKTVSYLVDQFKKAGALPGNPDGTYVQAVPLVGITSRTHLTFEIGAQILSPAPIEDFVAASRRLAPVVEIKASDLVFVGYGVVAPEYGWDDYKGIDVRGKTVVMLINDPPVRDPHDPTKLDERMFKGNAMTYYGRWTYKYEIASEKGAAACLIVHETGPAGYPFAVVVHSWGRENFDLYSTNGNIGRVAVEGWLSIGFTHRLFAAAGQDFDALQTAAARPDFHPVLLGATASCSVANTTRRVLSQNVAARIAGRDPSLRDEYIVHTAHWDHFGRDPSLKGDQIYHGAADNGSGVAVLLELARRYQALPSEQKPRRSVLLLSVTAEEQGLLGSSYYAQHPLYPLAKTVAALNTDMANHFAPTRDIEVVGSGTNTIEDVAAQVAAGQHRVLVPDSQPEKGSYYRSDHFSFAKAGVPALDWKPGAEAIGKPAGFMAQKRNDFTEHDYHKVTDTIKADWDFSALVQDVDFFLALERKLADDPIWPEWKPGAEFKSRRDAMLKR